MQGMFMCIVTLTGLCAQEQRKAEESSQLFERASAMYHESGHADTAGQVLKKAAT